MAWVGLCLAGQIAALFASGSVSTLLHQLNISPPADMIWKDFSRIGRLLDQGFSLWDFRDVVPVTVLAFCQAIAMRRVVPGLTLWRWAGAAAAGVLLVTLAGPALEALGLMVSSLGSGRPVRGTEMVARWLSITALVLGGVFNAWMLSRLVKGAFWTWLTATGVLGYTMLAGRPLLRMAFQEPGDKFDSPGFVAALMKGTILEVVVTGLASAIILGTALTRILARNGKT